MENEWKQWHQEARRLGLVSETGICEAGQWREPLASGQREGAWEGMKNGAAEGGAATRKESEDGAKEEGEAMLALRRAVLESMEPKITEVNER